MRVGFVAASLAAHLGVVGLAFYTHDDAPKASRLPASGESGLVSVELGAVEVAVAQWPERLRAPPDELGVASGQERATSARPVAPDGASVAPGSELPSNAVAGIVPGSRTPGSSKPVRPATHSVKQSNFAGVAADAPKPQVPETQTEQDWLSIDQQLPEAAPPPRVAKPERDELVERLLAKEREKRRAAEREEFERSHAADSKDAIASTTSPAPSSELQPSGASHDQADVWVELTRWLPRAASSDQEWERLPSDTRFDVQVIVRVASDAPVEVVGGGRVPAVVLRLLERTAHLMQSGRFLAAGSKHAAAAKRVERRFGLRIRLSQTAERELWIAHTTPDPPKPGVGSFVSPTGRRFDVWVQAEP